MWCNTQVSYSTSPNNSRSESEIEVNPLNPQNLVGSSKRFTNPATYSFSLAAYSSFDGGESWQESPPLGLLGNRDPAKVWAGVSDPAMAWDDAGNCYLVALPFPAPSSPYSTLGIAIYKSSDGGRTWSAPNPIHTSVGDDKQWATGDRNPRSRHFGNIYVAWDDYSSLAFARTTDRGATWRGTGTQPPGTSLASDSFSPSVAVANDGAVYIFWIAGSSIKFVKSTNGGNSFTSPQVAASGLTTLSTGLAPYSDFPKFPGAKFRVLTLPAACTGSGNTVLVAWADYREGKSRIYYRRSTDGGASWLGGTSGQPLLTGGRAPAANQHDFHPQLASTPGGAIACSYYEFGPKWTGGPALINTMIATSSNAASSFTTVERVTNGAWDPAVNAPWSHGNPNTTFIGDYFGLVGTPTGFVPFWTDTRTGIQEIFSGRRLNVGPWNGVQFHGTVPAHSTRRWFTYDWPACWHVIWEVVSLTARRGAPQIKWRVQVERATSGRITYWIKITNLTDRNVDVEARYSVLAAD